MDSDEGYLMNEEARITEEYECACCKGVINGYEAIDPFVIDNQVFCLYCASDLTSLRMQGYLRQTDKTKVLVEKSNWDDYYKMYDIINFGKA